MNVTLFSDASLCSHTGKGGWAAWIKSDTGTISGGGPFRHETIDTGVAEAMAAVNGLHLGLRNGIVRRGSRVLIQTDNNSVWHILEGRIERKVTLRALSRKGADPVAIALDVDRRNALIAMVVSNFRSMTERYDLEVRWRHVKGHQGREDARSAVNTICDGIAREHMEKARGAKRRSRRPTRRQRLQKIMTEIRRRESIARSAGNPVSPPMPVAAGGTSIGSAATA